MPIGVPRIIYCWGEELPAQWTDIYNFIFRRRMIFLMQYLDDELCNQICGLLINIHMEDRSKELEKKEIERSGVFKSSTKPTTSLSSQEMGTEPEGGGSSSYPYSLNEAVKVREGAGSKQNKSFFNKKSRSMEDLLNADEDLGIDEIDTLEQFTLQKITTEWLNWNAQFFDYSDEPYLFYLAELLSKDFNKTQNNQRVNEKNPLYFLTRLNYEASLKQKQEGKNESLLSSKNSLSSESKLKKRKKDNQNEQKGKSLELISPLSKKEKQLLSNLHSQLLKMLKKKESFVQETKSFESYSKNNDFGYPSTLTPFGGRGAKQVKQAPPSLGLLPKESNGTALASLTASNETVPEGEAKQGYQGGIGEKGDSFGVRDKISKAVNYSSNSLTGSPSSPWEEALTDKAKIQMGEVYSPFRTNTNFSNSLGLKVLTKFKHEMFIKEHTQPKAFFKERNFFKVKENISLKTKKQRLLQMFQQYTNLSTNPSYMLSVAPIKKTISNLLTNLAQKNFSSKFSSFQNFAESSEKILGQRNLRREFNLEKNFSSNLVLTTTKFGYDRMKKTIQSSHSVSALKGPKKAISISTAEKSKLSIEKQPIDSGFQLQSKQRKEKNKNYTTLQKTKIKSFSYLNGGGLAATNQSLTPLSFGISDVRDRFRDYYRKQTERALIEEESKKVFVIINSFGGSVGNGVTVHDALQFIKAGSLTLALGVAASAASLALAGGTIGERYVTEGCHVMIHQPECFTGDHMVLTSEGWLPIANITHNHKVAVLDPNGSLSYQHPTKIHKYDYEGPMYEVKSTGVDLFVTPNHRMYVSTTNNWRPNRKYHLVEASTISGNQVRYKNDAIWNAPDYQIVLPGIVNQRNNPSKKHNFKEIPSVKPNMDDWLFFFGLWVAEGHTCKHTVETTEETTGKTTEKLVEKQTVVDAASIVEVVEEKAEEAAEEKAEEAALEAALMIAEAVEEGTIEAIEAAEEALDAAKVAIARRKVYRIVISHVKPDVRIILEGVLKRLGYNYFYSNKQYIINNKQLWSYLNTFDTGALNKRLPDWVWELSSRQCQVLLDGLVLGNGYVAVNENTSHYFTGSKELALDVCRLALHAGSAATLQLETIPNRSEQGISGCPTETINPLWRVNILKNRFSPYANYLAPTLNSKNIKIENNVNTDDRFVFYKGPVYCLTVPNSVFYIQRNGKAVWTGNSALQGQASDIWIDSQEIMKIRLDVAEIYSLSTYRPRHKILRDLDRDFYLTATETIQYGLADEIATNEIMSSIMDSVNRVWDYDNSKQQRLLETRESASSGLDTQTQN